MKKIDIGFLIDFEKFIQTRALVQANSGGGKSYLLRKLIEQIHGHAPYIMLDLEGEFTSIREKYDVIVFGKGHDIPINIRYAEKLARYLLELSASAIIDLSELKHHERILFVKRFLESMIDAPKSLWHPTVVLLDEAHQFCPEDGKAESMNAVIDLCTRGRKRGYCAVLATQRLSKLNKDAAAELNNKIIGRTTLDVDVKRTCSELGMNLQEGKQRLRQLDEGEFYVFGPAIANEVTRQKVSPVKTTHMKTGMKFSTITPPSKALQKLIGRIAEIPVEAETEKDTIQALKERIKTLEATNKAKPVSVIDQSVVVSLKSQVSEYDAFVNSQAAKLQKILVPALKNISTTAEDGYAAVLKMIEEGKIHSLHKMKIIQPILEKTLAKMKHSAPGPAPANSKDKKLVSRQEGCIPPDHAPLGKCERSILTVLAQEEKPTAKNKIAIRSGYSANSGGFNNALGKLRSLGFIDGRGDTKITDLGIDALGDYNPLPVPGQELCDYWIKELPKCESLILAHLIQFHPGTCSKDVIADATGYSANSGGFNNALGKLRTLELIEGRGEIKASDSLFE